MPSYIRTRAEFAVNSYTAEGQVAPSVATFADGGFIIAWGTSDTSQDGSDSAIKAQLFDSAGRKVGFEFLVNSAAPGAQFTPSVATLSNGNFLVSWVTNVTPDGTDEGIKAQLFSRSGEPIGGEIAVQIAEIGPFTPNVAPLADGGFVISWDDWGGFDVKAQIFDSFGARVGSPFTVNSKTDYLQEYGDLTALAGGGFVATWRTTDSAADGSGEAVKAQIFDGSGNRVGAEFLVNSQKFDSQYDPSVASLAGGGFVVTWATRDSAQDGNSGAVKGQIFSASGAKVGGEFLVNTQAVDIQRDAVVTGTPDGGFLVAWTNYSSSQDGSGAAIKAQAFDAAGNKVGGEMLVNTLADGWQSMPDLATLADGRVIATWSSASGDSSGNSVRAQIFGSEVAEPLANTRPTIISNGGGTSASLVRDEGVAAVTTVVASDDGEPNDLRYSITGGYNADLFTIDALTGALAFRTAPDFVEGEDNFYSVTITVSDGELSSFQSIQISVAHVNYVTIVSDGGYEHANLLVDENQTGVTTVSAVDDDGLPLTYTITGGPDSALFAIDAQTGELSFASAPDYEAPASMYGDNVYYVQVTASDGTRSDTQDIAVQVNDVAEPEGFAIISNGGEDYGQVFVPENGLAVTVVEAGSAAGPVTYEIVGGYHAGLFTIDPETGVLAFVEAPDYETGAYGASAPWYYQPSYYDNVYDVVVRASDGVSSDEQILEVVVEDVDEAPIFHSFGGESEVSLTIAENSMLVGHVEAEDPDREGWVRYAIGGGADAALFEVDPYSGELIFSEAPDREAPADADGDNIYEVAVIAYSGELSAVQAFAITVEDEYEPVRITSNGGGESALVKVAENGSAVTVVAASSARAVTYEIAGGADAAWFTIDSATGALSFVVPPDYEVPFGHGNAGSSYDVIVRASDGESFDDQQLTVRVENVDEAPEFHSYGGAAQVSLTLAENLSAVTTVAARDPDRYASVTYAIAGGADAALFEVDPTSGALRFRQGPDFEAPTDADGDNVYQVAVVAKSGALSDTQSFSISIGNENEGVFISSNGGGTSAAVSVSENGRYVTTVVGRDLDGTVPSYSIRGGADAARFTIDAATGVLSFVDAPDFEAPADQAADNFYTVEVAAGDGQNTASQIIQVQVGDVDEGVEFVSYDGSDIVYLNLAENGRAAARLEAVDQDGEPVTYAITGGADAALFAVDSATGALSFVGSPNFEAPADSNGDNVYSVVVTASDGSFSDSQAVSIAVSDVNEAVKIGSNGGGATAVEAVVENRRTVTTVAASDPEGGRIVYAIAGGADAALFTINPDTGALLFVTAPDFEAPQDAGANNVYDVLVSASDGTTTDTQALAVSVRNANEGVTITSNGGGAGASVVAAENGAAVTTVAATDADGGPVTYTIAGGADAARFTIDGATGALAFVAAPNFEAPADAGGNNVYNVTVSASDGTFSDVQALEVAVANVREGATIYGNSSANTISASKTVTGQPYATSGEDSIYGLGGADTLLGGGGGDLIDGGTGNDAIVGGAGADELIGGTGADRFILQARTDSVAGAADLIRDFTRSQADRIDLVDIDANTLAGGNQAFAFIGANAFSKVAGQLRFEQSGGNTFVFGDVNGDGVADFQVQVQGLITLAASDFVL